ncbi:GNAT family N-acetyltransferase [Streptacidiphilus sp. PB12-B1b]|uniref:GNAT family N-acetyltransferase n=1 Tax=Streptacidiphilus sp. PB12-B1b TaxID=2705012 RepID=UPI0015F8B69A|nr:GNAT family N-acetyltransferase [Streptacidiphilus sp. PB12-B1b]QMU79739.1 GNAT family N-acetyltransferase [Streptacidiphilus sp. PB12-B1b]
MAEPTVTPARAEDKARWRELFEGYAAFYATALGDADYERAWSWIHDPARESRCLLARDADGRPIGLAHYRAYDSLLRGTCGFLDDLYVDPAHRGSGAADALLRELNRIGAEQGWPAVRWNTAEDNYRARGLYDRHAVRTVFLTYSMTPGTGA